MIKHLLLFLIILVLLAGCIFGSPPVGDGCYSLGCSCGCQEAEKPKPIPRSGYVYDPDATEAPYWICGTHTRIWCTSCETWCLGE